MEDGTTGRVEGYEEEKIEWWVDGGIGIGGNLSVKTKEPGRMGQIRRGCVKDLFEGIDLTACGRSASNQLVHACAGNPVPFSNVPGHGSQAVDRRLLGKATWRIGFLRMGGVHTLF